MLRLSRKRGDKVRIGTDRIFNVVRVHPDYILAEVWRETAEGVTDLQLHKFKIRRSVHLGDGIFVALDRVFRRTASIGFAAPKETAINREEVHQRKVQERLAAAGKKSDRAGYKVKYANSLLR